MMVTSLLNLILDPIFIFTLDLGINGAALATILSFTIGLCIVVPKVSRRHWLNFQWDDLDLLANLRSLGNIMGPAMISQLLPPLSSMLATKLLASFGTAAVAAWALGSRFEFVAIISVLALTMSMPPMIGRLLGAGKIQDIRQLVRIACQFVIVFQLFIAGITFVSSGFLSSLMTSEQQVESILSWHLVIVPFSLGPLGICMLIVSISNALGKSYVALAISALRLFAFYLPCLWLGSQWGGIQGLFWGAMIGNLLAGTCAWITYQRLIHKLELQCSKNSNLNHHLSNG